MTREFYNKDCMIDMPSFEAGKFRIALIDPPYGIGESGKKRGNFITTQKNGNRLRVPENSYIKSDWDNEIPSDDYFNEIKRISQDQIIFGANYFPAITGIPSFKAPRREFFQQFLKDNPIGWIIWDKVNGDNDFSDCELIWTSFNSLSYILPYMWNGMMQGKSIKEGKTVQGNKKLNEKRIHPCHKPVVIYLYLLSKFAIIGSTVIDTHVGSASSLIAMEEVGLNYVAYEKNTEIYGKAQKRINQYRSQLKMFT